MTTVAIFGAGGSMGTRASNRLHGDPEYRVLHVEPSEAGRKKLAERGISPVEAKQAAAEADVAVIAVPDRLIGQVTAQVVPCMKAGAMVICLDPAAPWGGKLPPRDDVTYFVTHPAHPPVFNDETDPEARRDFFGSGKAKQAIVCALVQGPEADYARGEKIAAKMFGPVLRSHRITVEQMAMLEPALAETVAATCITIIREAMDEVVKRGVPYQAAFDFIMGHINIDLAILFDQLDWKFSAGCQKAIADAKKDILQPDWKKVLEIGAIRESVAKITGDKD